MSASESDELPAVLAVATLIKAHGVKGELKIRATSEHLAILREVAEEAVPVTLRIPTTGDEYEVTLAHVRGHDSAAIVRIDGVDDRTAADEFRGAEVCVPRDILPEPDPDEYYVADLEGCRIHDAASGKPIGTVTRADSLPANIVLTITLDATKKLIYAPLAGDAVPLVDVDARRIDIDTDFLGLNDAVEDDEPSQA
ncbi:MAG: ribosome maturation factor RimM [Thermoleophilia bacterium]|nr:ribosome maturation factor RimM [Thermoleophilia bacterium]MCZ4495694.1 ribosome maturation factor RimM [Thermoleophilia bacterium]